MPGIINQKNEKVRSPLQVKLDSLPANAGIYQFKDKAGKIIYIGKAKNLRNRVRSYFVSKPVGPRLERMISLIRDVEIINTDSEVESLILEMNLIKQLSPRYNVNLKDDKSFPYIVITNELFPRIFPTRKRRNDGSKYFGPYTDVGSMKYSLKMLRDIYMIRTCSLNITPEAVEKHKFKVCLEYHIHKCEGPCEGLVSRERYCEMIAEAEKVLNGKTGTLIRELERKMNAAAENENFEEASLLRNRIQSLEVYTSKQKVVSEDYSDKDVINYVCEGDDACAMILNIRDGKVVSKRHFYLDTVEDKSESEILERVMFTYYSENNYIPDEIHLPAEIEDLEALKEWFKKKSDKKIDFIFPKRGEKMQLLSMVKTNARYMLDELKLQRLKREFIPNSISSLKRDLRLTKLPRRIECFDISNIQGTDTVASMVVFEDGRPKKSDYRKFKIRDSLNEAGKPDDFASMREVIYRRFSKIAGKNNTLSPTPLFEGEVISTSPLAPLLKGEGSNKSMTNTPPLLSEEGSNKSMTNTPPLLSEEGSNKSMTNTPPLLSGEGAGGEVIKTNIPYQTDKARALRKAETRAEKKLWEELKYRNIEGLKFRRQHPIGYYIVDFYCDSKNLIIEIDGSIHDLEENIEYDKTRQSELETLGYKIIRFTNDEVINDVGNVLQNIQKYAHAISTSPPTPFTEGEGSNKSSVNAPPLLPGEDAGGEEIKSAPENKPGGEVITAFDDPSFSKVPDLIVIDGGKGQLSSAVHVLDNIGITNQNIIGLAKKLEEVFVPGVSEAQSIPKTSSGLKLLQRVRDEAHRFAITFHRSLRDKRTIVSELEGIKGIGKLTAKKLLIEFGSVEKIKHAMNDNFGDFEKRAGKKVAERLKEWVNHNENNF